MANIFSHKFAPEVFNIKNKVFSITCQYGYIIF